MYQVICSGLCVAIKRAKAWIAARPWLRVEMPQPRAWGEDGDRSSLLPLMTSGLQAEEGAVTVLLSAAVQLRLTTEGIPQYARRQASLAQTSK